MARERPDTVLRHIHRIAVPQTAQELTDRELLHRFTAGHDEAAFAALVKRHAGLVWGVCRHVLGHEQDAEDAMQASFIVLARQAAAIRRPDSLAAWLYGVAYRTAMLAKRKAGVQRLRESPREGLAQPGPDAEAAWRELLALLDAEILRLPAKYRAPFILCCLEGRSRPEAARELGWREGTVAGRVAQARQLLRRRLARRGVALPAALGALALAFGSSPAAPGTPLAAAALAGAHQLAAGEAVAGPVCAPALVLARGVLMAMSWGKLTLGLVVLLAVALVAAGAGLVARQIGTPTPPAAGLAEALPAEGERARTDRDGDPLPPGALMRLDSARLRHAGLSEDLIFSEDGKTLTTSGYDRVVRTWDVAGGRLVRARPLPGADSGGCVLSRDTRSVAYITGKAVRVWDVDAGKELAKLALDREPDYAGFSLDGKTLVVGRNFRDVSLWDWRTGEERRLVVCRKANIEFGYGMGNTCSFSPDGKLVATGAPRDQPLSLWDVGTGREVKQIDCPTNVLAFAPDGKRLATATAQPEGTLLRLWDVAAGKEVLRTVHSKGNHIAAASFSRDGKAVAWVGWEATVLMDAQTGRELHRWPGWHRVAVFSPDGRTVATACGVTVRLWGLATGEERLKRPGHNEGPHTLAVSPDGRSVVATNDLADAVYAWDLATGRALLRIPWERKQGQIRSVGLSADGRTVAVGTFGGAVHYFDAATGKVRRSVTLADPDQKDDPYFKAVFLPPDGKEIVTLTAWQGDRLTRWDAASGRLLRRQACKPTSEIAYAFAPHGRTLALRTETGVDVLDVRGGRTLASLKGNWGGPLAFSPDGKLLAASRLRPRNRPWDGGPPTGTESVHVWDWAAGREVVACATGAVQFVALTPDGRWLVTVDAEALRVWETATGEEAHRLRLPEVFSHYLGGSHVSSLALTPEGRRAVTGMRDGTLMVWDLTTAAGRSTDLAALWEELGGADAGRAYRAVWALAAGGERAVDLLKERLRPAVSSEGHVRRLIADLDSKNFAVREAASRALADVADESEPELRKALKGASPEARRRLEEILSGPRTVRGKQGRVAVRAVQVLEAIAMPEAHEVLRSLARGAPAARGTREAEAALRRLEPRRAPAP